MTQLEWILLALAIVGALWAVVASLMATNYRNQVDNVAQAASIARDQNSGLRAVNEALVKMVRAFESEVAAHKRYAQVVEDINRVLIADKPKPRARRAPATTKKAPVAAKKGK
jgi:hypothetical protein